MTLTALQPLMLVRQTKLWYGQRTEHLPGTRTTTRPRGTPTVTDPHSQLAELVAKRFISRRDVKALQLPGGTYRPAAAPFQMTDLLAHLSGAATYGHYLLDQENKTKFFAYDIDLVPGDCRLRTKDYLPPCCAAGHGNWLQEYDLAQTPPEHRTENIKDDGSHEWEWFRQHSTVHPARPREDWHNRAHPGRGWWKFQMRTLGDMLASRIRKGLGVPALVMYTGNKGLHVYGLTGHTDAATVREGAIGVLESFGRFETLAGKNFYHDTNTDFYDSFSNFTIEVFPKQDTVEPGHYGNLMRLPFGKNLKNPQDPTFIVDERRNSRELLPVPDQTKALDLMTPFRDQAKWQ